MTNEEAICVLQSIKHVGVSMQKMPGDASDHSTMINTALKMAIEALKNEPKKGEWIKKVDNVGFVSYICSECGFELELEDCSDSYYCVNCGAKMKEANND